MPGHPTLLRTIGGLCARRLDVAMSWTSNGGEWRAHSRPLLWIDRCCGCRTGASAGGASGDAGAPSEDYAVQYLDFVVRKGRHKNPAIYNYLLSLLAENVSWLPRCRCCCSSDCGVAIAVVLSVPLRILELVAN